jgi:hypothetical protein
MEPKDKSSEIYRLWNLSAGFNWVAASKEMLFACLTNANPKEAQLMEFNGTIPPSYVEVSKILYKVVVNAEELEGMAAQRICGAIEAFLLTTMSAKEVDEFKKQNPFKEPKKYRTILEEMEDEEKCNATPRL